MGLIRLGTGGIALARAARRFDADLIHANTTRAGLLGAVAVRLGGPPLVVRAHEHVPLSAMGRAARLLLGHSARAIVTVSQEIARRFNKGLRRPVATCVYNSFDREPLRPRSGGARAAPRGARHPPGRAPPGPRGPDHALEGPGHGHPGAGAAALGGARRAPADRGRRRLLGPRGALRQPCLPARAARSRRRARRRRRRAFPRAARRRAGHPAARSTSRCSRPGTSRLRT